MARYDDDEYYGPMDHANIDDVLWGLNDNSQLDMRAQELFVEAFFNDNQEAYRDLIDYMWDTYEIDFEDAFDWEDFREWYDQQNS